MIDAGGASSSTRPATLARPLPGGLRAARPQNKIIVDASRSAGRQATQAEAPARRGRDAARLLADDASSLAQSDFYSYRYFASEGFLPGYNFPRLPLSAFIPGRRTKTGRDEFLSRPRFLAITEFGPRGIIYHEGTRT